MEALRLRVSCRRLRDLSARNGQLVGVIIVSGGIALNIADALLTPVPQHPGLPSA